MKNAIKELDRLLEKSIKKELNGETNVGLYYSGGIDSGLIDTYFDFPHKFNYDDSKYTAEDFHATMPEILKVLGEPSRISFSPFGWWKLGEQAKAAGVKHVFSGESADELFGGYIRWMPTALFEQAQREFPSYKSMFPTQKTVKQLCVEGFDGGLQTLLGYEREIAEHFGLTIHFPFLDKDIISFAWRLPSRYKMWNFENKVILRRLLEQRNPNYKHIEKKGLYCSVNKWIGSEQTYGKEDFIAYQERILNRIKK